MTSIIVSSDSETTWFEEGCSGSLLVEGLVIFVSVFGEFINLETTLLSIIGVFGNLVVCDCLLVSYNHFWSSEGFLSRR